MLRLTMALREDIAKKAVMDLFVPSLLEQFEPVKESIGALFKEQCGDFDWEGAKSFKAYIRYSKSVYIEGLPSDWVSYSTFRSKCDLPNVREFKLNFEMPIRVDSRWSTDLDKKYKKRAEDILRPWVVQFLTAEKAYKTLGQVLLGLNTVKQVRDTIPELAKYLPESGFVKGTTTTALMPMEQINRVRALFLPKQEEASISVKPNSKRSKK